MSSARSVVSEFSAVTSAGVTTSSLLQTCLYVKNQLELDEYSDDNAASTYHVKISSKTLKKYYVIPGEDTEEGSGDSSSEYIDGLFQKLAKLLKGLKEGNINPPRSDFVCFSALKYNKVFLDVDCVSCKNGSTVTNTRHFSSTKLLNVILSTVGRVFDTGTLDETVYLTSGKMTCGYHIFFNSLAYRQDEATATREMLFRELDFALTREKMNNISIDRNCTQMPLPTSQHSNSPHHTKPYRMIRICKDQWKREPMRWHDMDDELLKCFSCFAFSRNHTWIAIPKRSTPTPPPLPSLQMTEFTAADTDSLSAERQSSGDRKRKAADISQPTVQVVTEEVELAKRVRTVSLADDDVATVEMELDRSVVSALTSDGDCASFFVPGPNGEKEKNSVDSAAITEVADDDRLSALTGETSGIDRALSFVVPGPSCEVRAAPFDTSFSLFKKDVLQKPSGSKTSVSLLSENSDAVSFPVPREVTPPVFQKPNNRKAVRRKIDARKSTGVTATTLIDTDSDACKFVDKQYKNALLRAEESVATRSRVDLMARSTDSSVDPPRIYILPGTSFEQTRKYKLLVQLENVKRAVFTGDKFKKREWTDIKEAYFDQHMNNPVILKIFDYVFRDDRVKVLFEQSDSDQIIQSITQLMEPFESSRRDKSECVFPGAKGRAEKEARASKSRLISALVRVCSNMFVMITAMVSDFRRIQIVKKQSNQALLNCTVVDNRHTSRLSRAEEENDVTGDDAEEDDGLDCSASTFGFSGDDNADSRPNDRKETLYALLASLIVYEETNLSDHALYALLYYYHYFPINALSKLMNEVQHDGLMVTVMIRYFLTFEQQRKPLTLLQIFNGFNDVSLALWGPEKYISMKGKNRKKGTGVKSNNGKQTNRNPNPPRLRKTTENGGDDSSSSFSGGGIIDDDDNADLPNSTATTGVEVTQEEVNRLLCGNERRRKIVSQRTKVQGKDEYVIYNWEPNHMWHAIINYYLRPVVMHDDRLVFANDGYDTIEDDAIDSCVAHVVVADKITKADVATAFKDAHTMWRMPHGSQLIYESDLVSENIGCSFHINIALKIYETFCGGCLTRMKRVHRNYLIDSTRFNMAVYDVVAECRTAAVNLTSAIDRSYINLLLCQPVVPPVFEDLETRQLFMSEDEMKRGSFCCLSTMDYIRALNLFERANCQSKFELETCDYVERFLDDMYTGNIAADRPPNESADTSTRLLYTFFSLFIYEVFFNLRHAYAKRENCFISIERLCRELDVRELLVLFFGESNMTRVEGLTKDVERRIRKTADELSAKKLSSPSDRTTETACGEHSRFDVRPVLAADIPDKVARMKALFGQFGFSVMQEDEYARSAVTEDDHETAKNISRSSNNDEDGEIVGEVTNDGGSTTGTDWDDESKFEDLFYANDDWLENVYRRISDREMTGKNSRSVPTLSSGKGKTAGEPRHTGRRYGAGTERLFVTETVRTVMQLQLKRHIDHDRLGKLCTAATGDPAAFNRTLAVMKSLPMRLKLVAFILTVHAVKLRTTRLASDFVDNIYREPDGLFADERRVYEGEVNETGGSGDYGGGVDPPEKVWFKRTESVLQDRYALLLHTRWLAEKRFKNNFFVGLDPVSVYDVLYEYMRCNQEEYPAFKRINETDETRETAQHLCTAMMFLLVMSAYDQEVLELYLKMFLAVEWPGQWAKTIFVWKSNSNAGKSYLFDAIIKRACANSTCINDPKGGKENAPEKAEYVRNFVLFANEFSQANSNELKKIVSESTFKFRMNYGNMMNEIYATGKIMVNCNTLPPTSDEAAINRLTLFSMPFWFSKRQSISDALLNWTRGHSVSDRDHWEMAYRYELPFLFTDKETEFLKAHDNTKNETDLFDGFSALRPNMFSGNMDFSKATASLFLVQNKISRLYVSSAPPTERIVHGLVNITRHFSWLRFFNQLDAPVDFTTLPATSEAVRNEWLSLTLPYQEWKLATGAKHDDTCRAPVATINRSLQAFAAKKNVNYFGIRQFFETDFASAREAIEDVYFVRFDRKVFTE